MAWADDNLPGLGIGEDDLWVFERPQADTHQWVTRDGKIIHYRDMTINHLRNCLKMIDSGLLDSRKHLRSTLQFHLQKKLKEQW